MVDRTWLEKEFSEEEIKEAVWDCGSDKTPGPDGLNFHCLKAIWSTISGDVMEFVNDFHCHAKFVKGINSSFIALLPKKKNPLTMEDYRPISLINSMYKIISECLANRSKKVIEKIISPPQSAFIGDRNIFESILTCNEMIHSMKKIRAGSFIFKVDFEKAFDCVRWDFLLDMMDKMGFGSKWIGWIRECLSSARVSIPINGSPTKEIPMGCVLHQGDALSSFLFLIVAEGLHLLLEDEKSRNLLSGISVGDGGLIISHIQYVDDTILLAPATQSNVLAVKSILRWFEIFSGLKVNFRKSSLITFNMSANWCFTASSILKCKAATLPFTYLGVPISDSHCKSKFLRPVIEKHLSKLAIWKCKSLSIGGRITLLKSVMSALPIYFFSILKAPSTICSKLTSIQCNFFWAGQLIRVILLC